MADDEQERVTAALIVLACYGVPTDIQEVFVYGNPHRSIKPGALQAVLRNLDDQ
jgi:hypothetical protein